MSGRYGQRRGARVAVRDRRPVVPWWFWALLAAGVLAGMPTFAQSGSTSSPVPGVQGPAEGAAPAGQVPEVVKPPGSATLPQGNDGTSMPAPRSENPQVGGDGARPIPDGGVIVPPSTGTGSVIRPPASGVMPVIPPPGSAGGEKVVPK